MIRILAALLLGVASFSAQAAEPKLLGDRHVIDVRTEEEWQAGHIEGAELVPVDKVAERIEGLISNKSAPIALYCRSGRRAEQALQILKDKGYTNVVNYGGLEEAKAKVEASKQSSPKPAPKPAP
jgi:rhodanese-related sulfurtransferase